MKMETGKWKCKKLLNVSVGIKLQIKYGLFVHMQFTDRTGNLSFIGEACFLVALAYYENRSLMTCTSVASGYSSYDDLK